LRFFVLSDKPSFSDKWRREAMFMICFFPDHSGSRMQQLMLELQDCLGCEPTLEFVSGMMDMDKHKRVELYENLGMLMQAMRNQSAREATVCH
jgi:hypothetical protein